MTNTSNTSAPVALVTGADKGIGLETARRLAGAGYWVYLTARSSERGQAAAATAGAQFLELDVTSDESVRHAADSIEQAGGHLDVLVNNAGITGPMRDPHDYTADDMTEVLLTNVVGYIRADAGLTATDLSGGQGHSVRDGTDAIIGYALAAPGGPTATFADRDGTVPW